MPVLHPPEFRRGLLTWYDKHKRPLPWRQTRTPYRIWISEIMLQQTRVAVVEPRYKEFLRQFPTVQKLARAPLNRVLAAWSGLGYYRRVRNLHAAARIIARSRKFPQTSAELRELPGIGRYTACAIGSIAFGESVPVVDGNVERVLGRLLGARRPTENDCWRSAAALLDPARPGDFNQAMMELGATVCLPGKPLCASCPVSQFCRARSNGSFKKRATRSQKRRSVKQRFVIAIRRNAVYLVRRPPNALQMPGMWELPAAPRNLRGPAIRARHSITKTHFEVTAIISPRAPRNKTGKWIPFLELPRLPLTGLARKLLKLALSREIHRLQ